MSNANQWCVPDEVHEALGVDFDRSLSSIDVDLEAPPNAMNSTVFAVPDISSRKDDKNCSTSPGGGNSYRCLPDVPGDVISERYPMECYPVTVMHAKKMRYSQPVEIDSNSGVKRFCFSRETEYPENAQTNRCRPHSLSAPELRASANPYYSSGTMISSLLSQVVQIPALPPPQTMEYFNFFGSNSTFHYVLMAPTSAACKLHEETLAYLNQGKVLRKGWVYVRIFLFT